MPFPRLIAVLSIAVVMAVTGAAGAWAQAQTGTGGGPTSTVTAPHTSAVGRTKPPGAAAGADSSEEGRGRTPQQEKDDRIQKGICIGCGAK